MKLTHTKDYLLLIDEEAQTEEGDYIFDTYAGINNIQVLRRADLDSIHFKNGYFHKIIAHYPLTKEAKELDLPLLPNPFKEEVNIEDLAFQSSVNYYGNGNMYYKNGFINGYKATQTKQFSLEDMKKAIDRAYCIGYYDKKNNEHCHLGIKREEEIIQSLSTQQLPKEFIPEYKKQFIRYDESVASYKGDGFLTNSEELKTTTNSEGKEELVGTYRY